MRYNDSPHGNWHYRLKSLWTEWTETVQSGNKAKLSVMGWVNITCLRGTKSWRERQRERWGGDWRKTRQLQQDEDRDDWEMKRGYRRSEGASERLEESVMGERGGAIQRLQGKCSSEPRKQSSSNRKRRVRLNTVMKEESWSCARLWLDNHWSRISNPSGVGNSTSCVTTTAEYTFLFFFCRKRVLMIRSVASAARRLRLH